MERPFRPSWKEWKTSPGLPANEEETRLCSHVGNVCRFLDLKKKPPCFRLFPWEPSRARLAGSSHPQSGSKPTQDLRVLEDSGQAAGWRACWVGTFSSVGLGTRTPLCGTRVQEGSRGAARPTSPCQPCVWAGRRRVLGSHAAGTHIQSGAVRAPGGCWAPDSQSGTQCLCISSHIRLDQEPGTQHRNPKCVLLEPGARPTPSPGMFSPGSLKWPAVFVPGLGKARDPSGILPRTGAGSIQSSLWT